MAQISEKDSPMCIHCLEQIIKCKCKLEGLPGMLRAEVSQSLKTTTPSGQTEFELLDAIAEELETALYVAKKKHDGNGWPRKFLYAHEGIGLMKALEVIKRHREATGS